MREKKRGQQPLDMDVADEGPEEGQPEEEVGFRVLPRLRGQVGLQQ